MDGLLPSGRVDVDMSSVGDAGDLLACAGNGGGEMMVRLSLEKEMANLRWFVDCST